ncbi:hypothetical protein [Nocardioides hwasunensis]|uniref:Uncharacterized protein n=1 Tax=Nocardioides hwasunensis TaxID=397258 RepID=A0ABR8MP77_9ACTN|nr:hypothetical protein [Nocardioides hwasunensis]MBD3917116.1 hypothetical protein [Nocardioides hwasunensis]
MTPVRRIAAAALVGALGFGFAGLGASPAHAAADTSWGQKVKGPRTADTSWGTRTTVSQTIDTSWGTRIRFGR